MNVVRASEMRKSYVIARIIIRTLSMTSVTLRQIFSMRKILAQCDTQVFITFMPVTQVRASEKKTQICGYSSFVNHFLSKKKYTFF